MSVRFYDRYSSHGFWFDDRLSDHNFCLSATGKEGLNCLPKFSGSIAIAVYHFRPRPPASKFVKVRERVRTIDQDGRMSPRAPFEGTLPLQRQTASDIQAFGFNADEPPHQTLTARELDPWCLLRQDLYLDDQSSPFLIVHWKHTLNAITLLDVIPGDQTQISRG